MIAFEHKGIENTEATLKLALAAAAKKGLDIVAASTTGDTVLKLVKMAEESAFENKIICVPHVYGMYTKGENEISREIIDELEKKGVKVVIAAHALSGAERGLSSVFKGVYPVEIVAAALRMFGQGTKVCVEIALMAQDAGVITYGKPVVAIGGSAHGADTACILTPGYTASLLETKIHEIICKPDLIAK